MRSDSFCTYYPSSETARVEQTRRRSPIEAPIAAPSRMLVAPPTCRSTIIVAGAHVARHACGVREAKAADPFLVRCSPHVTSTNCRHEHRGPRDRLAISRSRGASDHKAHRPAHCTRYVTDAVEKLRTAVATPSLTVQSACLRQAPIAKC